MVMKITEVKKWIRLVEQSNISELEISEDGKSIRITKSDSAQVVAPSPSLSQPQPEAVTQPVAHIPEQEPAETIKSPMVGTFFTAPSPDTDPFVSVGDTIKKGQVLCIIEAMKIMNELEAEVNGVIKEILVKNSNPVEFNQPLFVIESH